MSISSNQGAAPLVPAEHNGHYNRKAVYRGDGAVTAANRAEAAGASLDHRSNGQTRPARTPVPPEVLQSL
jgi:hypothetical protein